MEVNVLYGNFSAREHSTRGAHSVQRMVERSRFAGVTWARVRKREVERCWESMTTIADHLSTFIRFIQLKSLRKRTEEDVRWLRRLARQCGVACTSLLGQEEGLAFRHDLPQNHGDEGSTINQAGGVYSFYEKGWLEGTTVPSFDLLSS